MNTDKPITAYKAFDANMKCLDFQFVVGETYTHIGKIKACDSGFHACENPLDVLSYYNLCDSRFAVVEQSGEIDRHAEDSKIASAVITIKAELRLPEFIKSAIDWMLRATQQDKSNTASGDDSQLAASGYGSQLAASGDGSQLAASGYDSKLAASGDGSQLAASGYGSIAIAASLKCKAKTGKNGCVALTWHDGNRYRISVGYVGEGLKSDTWYRLGDSGEFVEDK